jgi:hypothetical protein
MNLDDLGPIDLPQSNFLGPYDPQTGRDYTRAHSDAEDLWAIIDNRLDDGIAPEIVNLPIDRLLATQDWIGGTGGHGVSWDELDRYPVVLQRGNRLLIIDGHHRVSESRDCGADTITAYLFR